MATVLKENKKVESDINEFTLENKINNIQAKLKKCFIITPIGSDNSEIRRQIDGVIDACIKPTLVDFDVYVSHRICTTGSINNQIINHIYEDDLVIANLTSLNPNVMYELAFRHAIRKPIIVIKNKNDGCQLPFDIKDDRTIFYTDDIKGTIELKEELKKFIDDIDYRKKADNPISRAIKDYKTRELFEEEIKTKGKSLDSTNYLLKRLDEIERKIDTNSFNPNHIIDYKEKIFQYDKFMLDLKKIYDKARLVKSKDKNSLIDIKRQLDGINNEFLENRWAFTIEQKIKFRDYWTEVNKVVEEKM